MGSASPSDGLLLSRYPLHPPSLRATSFSPAAKVPTKRPGFSMAIQRPMERGKTVPRRAVFGMIGATEAISLTRDLPIAAGAQERAEESGLSNTPSPFAAGFLSTVTQTTRFRLPAYRPLHVQKKRRRGRDVHIRLMTLRSTGPARQTTLSLEPESAGVSSFISGTVAILVLAWLAPILTVATAICLWQTLARTRSRDQ